MLQVLIDTESNRQLLEIVLEMEMVQHPEMLIIAYSSSDELGQEMSEAGAFVVVPKTGDTDELIQAIDVAKQAVFGRRMLVTQSN